MKTVFREYSSLSKEVQAIGIEHILEGDLVKICNSLINKGLHSCYISSMPSGYLDVGSSSDVVKIGGIEFFKVASLDSIQLSSSKIIEEIIIVLSENNELITAVKDLGFFAKLKHLFLNDPYIDIKNLGAVDNVIVLFYGPAEKDIDLFVSKRNASSIVEFLNKS